MIDARQRLERLAERENEKVEALKSEHQRASESKAAETIQRNYRGYRDRRAIKGHGLSASTRWAEAVKEARYRNATRPLSRGERSGTASNPEEAAHENARKNWALASQVARRAGADDISESDEDESLGLEERAKLHAAKLKVRHENDKHAKMMDLQYFLEMVDKNHRYGSNLRSYHEVWKKSDTNENFFYWLDHGEGRQVEVPTVPRARLNSEKVRYLSREERQQYLVKIDGDGRLCWAKNGMRITTSLEYKDSMDGIVPTDDVTPAFGSPKSRSWKRLSESASSTSSSGSAVSTEGEHYVNHDLNQAKGLKKVKHVSAATILNHLLRKSVKPNSWIFVADTSFRLYVGIKQSGAFQHSSFLHGSRISAAGLIKIKDGQLRRLSPLSGHYRPPSANFRAFVHSLRDAGVDMSRVSISRSYAVLVGLEAYVRTRKKFKHGIEHLAHGKDKVLHPDEVRKRAEAEKDKSKSAQRERETLAAQERAREEAAKDKHLMMQIRERLQDPPQPPVDPEVLSKDGQDAEAAIPPDGSR